MSRSSDGKRGSGTSAKKASAGKRKAAPAKRAAKGAKDSAVTGAKKAKAAAGSKSAKAGSAGTSRKAAGGKGSKSAKSAKASKPAKSSARKRQSASADRRATAVADAVRGLIVALDGRVTELEAGREYRFGRDPACEVVAIDSLVSRAHCRVRWDADRYWILEDLDSANGTWIRDRRITAPRALVDDEVFRIGGQEYRFRFLPPGVRMEAPTAEPLDRKRTVSNDLAADEVDQALAGRLDDTDLPQLLCYFALSGRSGRLVVDDGALSVDLVAGVPRAAQAGKLRDLAALREAAARPGRRFAFTPGTPLANAEWRIPGSPEAIMLAAFGPAGRPPPDADDLAKAGAQQRLSMPEAPAVPGLEIGITYQALCGVGGDFYELAELADGRVLAVLGDVSGHGVQAALVVAGLLRSLRYLAPTTADLRELAVGLDRDSHRDLLPGQFATAVLVALDVASGRGEVLLTGHHPARLLVPGQLPRPVGRLGPAIGLSGLRIDPARLQVETVQLAPGATLVLFSDALLEARDAAEREFEDHGLDRALEALAEAEELQPGVSRLAEACRAHAGAVDDDLSILALRRRAR